MPLKTIGLKFDSANMEFHRGGSMLGGKKYFLFFSPEFTCHELGLTLCSLVLGQHEK